MSRRIYVYNETLGMCLVPGVSARVRHEGNIRYMVEANSHGFRCRHEFTKERTPGKARILLFGDSFTVGPGVKTENRFGDLIERELPDVEVYNLGLTGTGTDQQYLAYHHVGAEFDHDLVLFAPWVENIRRNPARYRVWNDRWVDHNLEDSVVLQPKPYFEFDDNGELELHNFPVPRAVPYESVSEEEQIGGLPNQRFGSARAAIRHSAPWIKDVIQMVSRIQPVPEYDDANHPHWLLMKGIIEKWHAESTTPMLVCPIPMYQHIEGHASPKGYLARYQELHRPQDGLIFHDVLPAMRKGSYRKRRAMRFEKDIHLTDPGHLAYAEAMLPAIQAALGR